MANNEYVNRVDFGNETLIDISNTTAEPEDVIEGQTFYTRSGAPATGTLGDATTTTHGLMSATDKVKLDEIDSKKAPIIIDSKSGNPIVVNDGISGLKLYDMKVSFAPKQAGSGDPSPDNIRQITGWDGVSIYHSGKNLLDVNDEKKISFNTAYSNWSSENGIVTITGNATGGYIMPCLPETGYVYSFESTYIGENLAVRVYEFTEYPTVLSSGVLIVNDNSSVAGNIPPKAFTTTSTGKWLVVGFYAHPSENIIIQKMQIELGSTTATSYEPYSGTTIPISWQTEAGTVYGGELDVTTGILTVTHAVASASKSIFGTSFSVGIGYRQTPARYDKCLSGTDWNKARQTQIMANGKIANPYSETTYGDYIGIVYQIDPTETKATLRISEALYQALGDEDIVSISYELQTPYTVQLTASQIALLAGTNTIWTDADTAEIAYPVDTKKYVDAGVRDVQTNGISILNNSIANIPIGKWNVLGLIKPNPDYGTLSDSSGTLKINLATDSNIKAGTNTYKPIVSYNQHQAVFYGLAKAAGDVTQVTSNNTIGTYTNEAKLAIKTMLGITEVPAVTSVDEGKVLRVVNGEWSAISLPSVSEVSW